MKYAEVEVTIESMTTAINPAHYLYVLFKEAGIPVKKRKFFVSYFKPEDIEIESGTLTKMEDIASASIAYRWRE